MSSFFDTAVPDGIQASIITPESHL